ncbi:nucleotide exchange factor GrpE [Chitinophaga sedimenti]|uniref:nucleotide exchange factor GrpE n=1 Tax=Chitinophaga sedimenti TaxID=2033606 RepID=UPI0020030DCB|nr:nucleotide exchange factor GrpE [Chitinophaga sedimenti]MCK7559724.1 nucleotide exchange factor GrpE [Chitinophaga sedimenti]
MTDKDKDIQDNTPDINTDENMSGTSHLNDALTDESNLEKAEKEAAEMRDKYLRLVAEFDNFKKRNAKERLELIQTANKEVIIAMLDVLDDMERAQKQLDTAADVNAVKEGVNLVFNKLKSTMSSKGLKPMETIHKEFDADLHEAITETRSCGGFAGKSD